MPYRNTAYALQAPLQRPSHLPCRHATATLQTCPHLHYSQWPLALQIPVTCTTANGHLHYRLNYRNHAVALQQHYSQYYRQADRTLQVLCRNDYRQRTTDFSCTTAFPKTTTATLRAATTGCTTEGAVLHYSIGAFTHYSHLDTPLQSHTCRHAVERYSTVGMCSARTAG